MPAVGRPWPSDYDDDDDGDDDDSNDNGDEYSPELWINGMSGPLACAP